MATGPNSVLKKKLGKIQSRGYNFPVQTLLAAKIEHAAARGTSAALGVTIDAIVEESRVTRLGALLDTLPAPGLFTVLRTASGEQAVAGFDMPMVDHVVDISAGGDPNIVEDLPARAPTDLDGALCSMVVEAVMRRLQDEIRALGNDAVPESFVIDRIEHMPVNLGFLLPEQQYLGLRATLDTGSGGRSGRFFLVLPLSWIEPIAPALRRAGHSPAPNDSSIWRRHMRSVVRATPLQLTAVIDSFPMQVADMAQLETGKLFPLPSISLDDLRLELDTGTGRQVIARGRLGIHKNSKAIRIIEPLGGEFLDPLADALSGD